VRFGFAAIAIAAFALATDVATPEVRAAKGPFDLGLQDPVFSSRNADMRALWLDRARAAGSGTVRFGAQWRSIATARPAAPSDPSDPAYDWTRLDEQVRAAAARGFNVLLAINRAPDWAEGPNREPGAPPGSWKPDPDKLAQFATAAARRYSGSYPDPLQPGAALPRIRDWQVWAEQNLVQYLNPQFERGRPVSPDHFRKMVNAFYSGIKSVSGSNRVVAGSTAPFGRPPYQIAPLEFWRKLLCLRGKKLKQTGCPDAPVRFDVLAHNPLSWYVPSFNGKSPWRSGADVGGRDDVLVPDMKKLARVLAKARKHRTLRPRRRTQLWATELLWESNPPDASAGVPLTVQAKWLADALYLLWRQRVSKVIWVRLVDPPNDGALQSGLYFNDGSPKPALTAYRFPFVAVRKKGKTKVWGRAPAGGKVEVQKQRGGDWKTIKRLRTRRSNVFAGKVSGGRKVELRAALGDETSLARKPR
jgi:hypothetical protein